MLTEEKGYRLLRVWQEAHALTLLVYHVTKKFPREELFGLTSQIRRAAVSVPANIVEGHARHSKKEFVQFLHIANGSLVEVEYYIGLSYDLQYIDQKIAETLSDKRRTVGVLLHKLIFSLMH